MAGIFEQFSKMVEYNASDLYLTAGMPAIWRAEEVVAKGDDVLNNMNIWEMAREIMSQEDEDKLQKEKELNIAHIDKSGSRYRVNIFFQQQNIGIVVRRVSSEIPTLDELQLPEIYKDIISQKNGLVLVVGTAGSGKSSSIAAMLDYRNKNAGGHVVTVEDPIEYVHKPDQCIFTQREVGIDTHSWDNALKNALRQRPDIIYIGEIRDAETMRHAMNFSETGHLCIATLHATTADHAIERIVNFFPVAEKTQNLYTLAQSLKVVIAQRVVATKRKDEHTIAIEVLKNEGLIKSHIMTGQIDDIHDLMAKNSDIGMQTFDQSLVELYQKGTITEEKAIEVSDNPGGIKMELNKVSAQTYKNEF